jgi:hypothetical protein
MVCDVLLACVYANTKGLKMKFENQIDFEKACNSFKSCEIRIRSCLGKFF